jgi:hypothetical protein
MEIPIKEQALMVIVSGLVVGLIYFMYINKEIKPAQVDVPPVVTQG